MNILYCYLQFEAQSRQSARHNADGDVHENNKPNRAWMLLNAIQASGNGTGC